MKKSTKILIPSIALSIFTIAGVTGAGFASADDSQNLSIAQRLANRFNLSVDDVSKVFEEQKQERQAEMKQKQEEKLDALVSEGKITEEQKQLLIDKFEEKRVAAENKKNNRLQDKENLENMTEEQRDAEKTERQTEMKAEREEMEKWFADNGIDKDLFSKMGEGGQKGSHRGLNDRK